eukprot:7379417-Prymnesium_polylepis.1
MCALEAAQRPTALELIFSFDHLNSSKMGSFKTSTSTSCSSDQESSGQPQRTSVDAAVVGFNKEASSC